MAAVSRASGRPEDVVGPNRRNRSAKGDDVTARARVDREGGTRASVRALLAMRALDVDRVAATAPIQSHGFLTGILDDRHPSTGDRGRVDCLGIVGRQSPNVIIRDRVGLRGGCPLVVQEQRIQAGQDRPSIDEQATLQLIEGSGFLLPRNGSDIDRVVAGSGLDSDGLAAGGGWDIEGVVVRPEFDGGGRGARECDRPRHQTGHALPFERVRAREHAT